MKTIAIAGVVMLALTGCAAFAEGVDAGASAAAPEATTPEKSPLLTAKLSCARNCYRTSRSWTTATLSISTVPARRSARKVPAHSTRCWSALLAELETTEAVKSHLGNTRALDGQQTDSWGDYKRAAGPYHPDSGPDVTFTWTPAG